LGISNPSWRHIKVTAELSKAASLLGRKGGRVVTPKKLAALRENVKKAIGKKKGKKYPEKKVKPPVISQAPLTPEGLSAMASLMGKKGGSVKSKKKAISSRLNARGGPDGTGKKAGRRPKYTYEMKKKAVLGPRVQRPCIIPDQVYDDIERYAETKENFVALYKGPAGTWKRANVSVYSRERRRTILIQSFTKGSKKTTNAKKDSGQRTEEGTGDGGLG
jgi:hypothetical protein